MGLQDIRYMQECLSYCDHTVWAKDKNKVSLPGGRLMQYLSFRKRKNNEVSMPGGRFRKERIKFICQEVDLKKKRIIGLPGGAIFKLVTWFPQV